MLKKIYVDNYRCFVNFEMELDRISLLMGPNGGGKSTLFDALHGIRRLIIENENVGDVFLKADKTKWIKKDTQTFELLIEGNEGIFVYKLVIKHDPDKKNLNDHSNKVGQLIRHSRRRQYIQSETLNLNGKPIFKFIEGNINLYDDIQNSESDFRAYDDTRSFLSITVPRKTDAELIWFINWFEKLQFINIMPQLVFTNSDEATPFLLAGCLNFPSWYEYFSLEHQDKLFDVIDCLRGTISGFDSLKLVTAGKEKILQVGFKNGQEGKKDSIFFDFSQLSDGQKVMIILYTLVIGLKDLGYTLLFDEPENFVALAEIQPWLMELNDNCQDGSIQQSILISHHPDLIDYFGADCGKWIEREPLSHSRVKPLPSISEYKMNVSEQISRGWTE